MEQILYRYNPWWEGDFRTETLIDRPRLTEILIKQLSAKDIVFLTGLRRIGKTTALKMLINHLINKKNISSEKIFYISLDDYLLSKHSIIEIVDVYRKIHKLSFNQKIYLFLDEITYQKDFEQQLKNLYDTHNVKIYTSTSQSASLKIKKAFITGRSKIIELLPLDFDEYLEFKNIKINRRDMHLYEKYFEEFLQTGGIPEYVLRGDIEYLKELVDDIILKDIAAVNNIKDIPLLKDFYLLLMERSGKIFSINKIANILNSSPDTIRRYLNYFNETYLIYLMPRYGKTNERILSPKKIYAPDLGIRNLFTGFRDKGSLFENYVYLKLRHRRPSYIYKDGIEIDFITEDKILIKVKYSSELNKKQKELFDSIKAEKKHIVTGFNDLTKTAVLNM
ncbi:MAG TPA: ATP-binding protein [Ignavibacteria bacterium]|nr:ATP-binding protein [Ignavibacteria bacterium]